MHYNIALLAPAGYPHAMAFREVALLLGASFQSLGIPAAFQVNMLDPDAINVILAYHLIQTPASLRGIRYVVYQLEQFSGESAWFGERQMEVLRGAEEVWDYSAGNIAALGARGISAKLLPLGYHERLEMIPAVAESAMDIDVLHYGTMNARRREVLRELAKHCRVKHLEGVYGEERDAFVARAKLVLSVHYYESKLPAQVRISYLLNNRKAVVAQAAGDGVEEPFEGMVESVAYAGMVAACLRLLGDLAGREALAARGYDEFKKRSMSEYLRKVLPI